MNGEGELITMFSAAVGNYGFPIAVTIYLLLSFQKKMEELTRTINELRHQLENEGRN